MKTLPSRLLLLVAAIQIVVLALAAWAAYRVLQQSLTEATRARAEALQVSLATALAPSLAARDFATVRDIAQEAAAALNLPYLAVADAAGRPLVAVGAPPPAAAPPPGADPAPDRPAAHDGRFYFSAPIALAGRSFGRLDFALPRQPIVEAERQLLARALLIGALGLAAALLLLLPTVRLTTQGLRRLAAAAERMGAGDPGVHVPEQGTAEVRALAAAFNRMSGALAERIAALEESEARQRSLVDALAEGVVFQDADDRVLAHNDAALRILGLTHAQLIGAASMDPRWNAIREDGRPYDWTEHPSVKALRSGQPQRDVVMGVTRADGTRAWLSVNSEPLRRAGGERPYATVTSFADITGRVEAERRLRELNAELERRVAERTADLAAARDAAERASHAKSDFLSRMSHELRTPLNAILGFAQVLQLRPDALPAALREQVQQIERAGWHLLELINEVLDLARVEAGALRLSVEPVDAGALALECVRLAEPAAAQAGVALQIERAAPDVHARADRTRVRQVLMNLLSNAVKYNRRGGRVTVRVAAEGEHALLAVADTGRGFTSEQLARLYEPFDRLGADGDSAAGTGIGLVITKRLVELMGGTLSLVTEPAHGSEFVVRLPRAQPPPAAPQAPAQTPGSAGAPAAARRTVLYVEDNPSNVELMKGVLAMRPHLHLQVAGDGAAALALARALQPDLLVLDVALPDISGIDLCRQLRADPALRERPIVALTANAMPADVARGSAAGFDAYLTKPLDVPQFLATLDRLLGPSGAVP